MNFDIVIVGAGMVGATLAAALGRAGVSVALIEREAPKAPGRSEGLRVSAISPTSQQILTSVGVWPGIAAGRVSPYQRMMVWDALNHSELTFDAAELGLPVLGHIIENQLIQSELWGVLKSLPEVVIYCPDELQEISEREDHLQVSLGQGAQLRCQLLVGADGAHSKVREYVGIETAERDYQQRAIVCHVRTEREHAQCARQCFQPTGPVAFLPLADGRCSVVWSTSPELAEELLALSAEDFSERLGEAFEFRLGAVEVDSKRASFPLQLRWAKASIASRVAIIGDAAHVIHPLAGLGVNLGLKDAAALSEVVVKARARKQDPGAHHVLRRYERWRKGDNLVTAATLHGIKHLFSNAFPPLAWLRGMGLGAVSAIGPVRQAFARYAVGQTGDLPEMARTPSSFVQ